MLSDSSYAGRAVQSRYDGTLLREDYTNFYVMITTGLNGERD